MPSLMREKRNYTPRELQEIAGLYWQEQGKYPWGWILRALDQEDRKRRPDEQVLLSGGTLSSHGISHTGRDSRRWSKFTTRVALQSSKKAMAHMERGAGPCLGLAGGKGTKRLSEAGLLERRENGRPGTWPDGSAPWEGQEDAPFTSAIGSVLVRRGPSTTKKFGGCSPLQAEADDRRKVVLAWAHPHPWE